MAFGSIDNYENSIRINNRNILGVDSINIEYSNNPNVNKFLGSTFGLTTINGTVQQKVSISSNLIYKDPLLSYIENSNFAGSIHTDNKSYEFKSGYLNEYMVNCSIGNIPKITSNIIVFDEMSINEAPNQTIRNAPLIYIPNQGSISATCDGSSTNRVIGFDYAIKIPRKPIYTIGSKVPSQIIKFPVTEYAASVQIELDDLFLRDSFSFFSNRQDKKISFSIKDRNNEELQSLSIPNASLISESLSSNAEGGLKLTLNYIGHL
jgi:hypothetical protein